MLTIGIDSGSTTTKGVLFDGQKILKKILVGTGGNPRRVLAEVYKELKGDLQVYTVATGYGRELLPEADKVVTEISCHGRGATFLKGNVGGIIDIGGQDSKAILLDRDQNLVDFLMNDKCAAGTGRFIETIMRVLHQDIENLDDFVREAKPVKISSMCTVFAESEVVSLLADNQKSDDIALGVLHSISERTANFAKKLPMEGRIFFSGGLARSEMMRKTLEEKLGLEVVTDPLAPFAGAIGAAVIGHRR